MSLLVFLSSFLAITVVHVLSVPVDNGVVGEPEIECGDSFVGINFRTRNPFQGRIFVKDRFIDPECRVGATHSLGAPMQIPFTSCGVQRRRSADPRGVFVGVTIIISFHPQFITKVDRAYMIQCFYMESWKTITAELQVSMLTTAFQTETVPMPVCRYEVLSGGPEGTPVRFVRIGDQVYHKWTCDTETVDTFCMIVHSCKVDDGAGDQISLVNEIGCGLDRHILGNIEYITDLMAGKEAHVFKYADRTNLYFDCQITITVKVPGLPCPRPGCPELRGKRSQEPRAGTMAEAPIASDKKGVFEQLGLSSERQAEDSHDDVCMSLVGFSSYTALNTFFMLSSAVLCLASLKKSVRTKPIPPNIFL